MIHWPKSIVGRVMTIVIAGLIGTASGSPGAQWFTYPSPGAPRTAGQPFRPGTQPTSLRAREATTATRQRLPAAAQPTTRRPQPEAQPTTERSRQAAKTVGRTPQP